MSGSRAGPSRRLWGGEVVRERTMREGLDFCDELRGAKVVEGVRRRAGRVNSGRISISGCKAR